MLPRSLGSYFKIHHVHSHAWKIRKLSLMALTQNKSIHPIHNDGLNTAMYHPSEKPNVISPVTRFAKLEVVYGKS